jgi:2-succinyl-6-hydroxy-2,4-cyclohexadiene-1-carboxylate synthase
VLHSERWGDRGGDPLILVHGFTQSGRSWDRVGQALAASHAVTAIDAPGHGRSAVIEADLVGGADLMVEAVPAPATWLGYSMGGRYALHVALRHHRSVRRLVLVSATGGIDDPAERAERRRSDENLAARVEKDGVENFVRWWLAQPMFASLGPSADSIESRLGGTPAGLASSLRLAGTGTQTPLWDQLRRLDMPVLVMAGEYDEKYVRLAGRLVESIGPNASLRVISNAGHACHLEQPERFLDALVPFLEWTDGALQPGAG